MAGRPAPASADIGMAEGRPLQVGSVAVAGLHTPGHAEGHYRSVTQKLFAPPQP